jgi:regulator of CtrA degradation
MSDVSPKTASPWRASVVTDFCRSELFERTFDEGMGLVEETAAYLDGAGRQESKMLSRTGALAYAAESMKLTTRLMQVASWLLVQRAVKEGNMAPADACEERYRLREGPVEEPMEGVAEMPPKLAELVDRSHRLYDRIHHLDQRMYVAQTEEEPPHPVLTQHDMLRAAFGE